MHGWTISFFIKNFNTEDEGTKYNVGNRYASS